MTNRYQTKPTTGRTADKIERFPFMVVDTKRTIAVGFYTSAEKADAEAARRNDLDGKKRR